MKNKNVLYIGNNLTKKTNYSTTISLLSNLLKQEGCNVVIKSDKINKIYRLLDMIIAVFRYRKSTDYLLIDTYSTINFYYALFVSQLARVLKIKYIPILHGGNLPNRINESVFFSKLIFKNSYKNIAPSFYLKSSFEKEGYKTNFIPNTINIEEYFYKKREKLHPNILWVRAFKDIYNPTLAVKVLHLLKKEYSKATLCMVGPFSDSSYNKAKELTKHFNLDDSIEFTNILPKKEWHEISKRYDIFINTTNFDNTPVSVIEAMALGLTVVSTNVGGMPFLIQNDKDGILVEKNNEELMTKAIIDIINNNNIELAINARQKVESFDWSLVKGKWKEILK